MAGTALAILMTVLAATAPLGRASRDSRWIDGNRAALVQAWNLLKLSKWGQSPDEHAAFIVRGADGSVRFVVWPYHREYHRATWDGVVPTNVVAIIHTHPNTHPYPSRGDQNVAARTGLPVYVVTRTMITVTEGPGVELVLEGDWNPGLSGGASAPVLMASAR